VSSHYATADVWIGNVDSDDEAEHITQLIDAALAGAGYHATVNITTSTYED
jgi:hypothetical protein